MRVSFVERPFVTFDQVTSLDMTMAMVLASPVIGIQPPKLYIDRAKRSSFKPPTFSFTRICSNRLNHSISLTHAVKPVSAIIKKSRSPGFFVGNMNWVHCFGSSLNHFDEKDHKVICHSKKVDAGEEEKPSERTNNNDSSTRKSGTGSKPSKQIYTILVGALFCVVLGFCSLGLPKTSQVPYSNLVKGIKDGSVTRVEIVEDSRKVYFNMISLEDDQNDVEAPKSDSLRARFEGFFPKWDYNTIYGEDDKYDLLRKLNVNGITFEYKGALLSSTTKNLLLLFIQLSPVFLIIYEQSMRHSVGKLNKKKQSKKQSVTFDDVKGVDDAKTELLEMVLCIKGDRNYAKVGAKPPRGVLLTGPPGTGKTLLARAVAGEAGVSFFDISASEFVEVYVGVGAARVRELFREAKKNSPSIIFIDEIDAVGGHRGKSSNSEHDQTLNQLLTLMDGFEEEENVVVIAATNRPDTLDPSLRRKGRFSSEVLVNAPDKNGRKEIIAFYLRHVVMEENKEDISELVASLTPGLVGADLNNIVEVSKRLAGRRGGEFVSKADILEAVDRARVRVKPRTSLVQQLNNLHKAFLHGLGLRSDEVVLDKLSPKVLTI